MSLRLSRLTGVYGQLSVLRPTRARLIVQVDFISGGTGYTLFLTPRDWPLHAQGCRYARQSQRRYSRRHASQNAADHLRPIPAKLRAVHQFDKSFAVMNAGRLHLDAYSDGRAAALDQPVDCQQDDGAHNCQHQTH